MPGGRGARRGHARADGRDGPRGRSRVARVTTLRPVEAEVHAALADAGRLTFPAFLEIVLYGPHGYYARAGQVVGAAGDFVTSPELHPAFGACVGAQARALWRCLGAPAEFVILEYGAGSGALARDLLAWARAEEPRFFGALGYRIVERSAALVERQHQALAEIRRAGARIEWLGTSAEEPPGAAFVGLALAHEFLDALPFHLVTSEHGRLLELYVVARQSELAFEPAEPSTPSLEAYLASLGCRIPDGARAEMRLGVRPWLVALASRLVRGALLIIDYGREAERLFCRARPRGTLRCYYAHTVNDDPLARVGLQDITADVDFTGLRHHAASHGFSACGLGERQHDALERLGLSALRREIARADVSSPEREANQAALQELLDPEGLGNVGWLLHTRGLDDCAPVLSARPPRWEPPPLLGPQHLRLPRPESLEALGDFAAQWRAFWGGEDAEEQA